MCIVFSIILDTTGNCGMGLYFFLEPFLGALVLQSYIENKDCFNVKFAGLHRRNAKTFVPSFRNFEEICVHIR